MKDGKVRYKIIAEFEGEDCSRKYEKHLIQEYKKIGQAKFNKQVH